MQSKQIKQLIIFLIGPNSNCLMTSYAQTTIHSKNSKKQKTKGQLFMGRLIKGIQLAKSHTQQNKSSYKIAIQDISEPDSKMEFTKNLQEEEIQRKSKKDNLEQEQRKLNIQQRKVDSKIQFQSSIFPVIYYKKTTMRNVLKQFEFPQRSKALPPNDERTPLIYQIIANLFNQINFYVFNILVSADPLTNYYYAFFSDSEIIPFTKCCNVPAYIQMPPNRTGRILCNGKNCSHPNLVEFLINFEDGRKIWKNLTFLDTAPQKDIKMKDQIAKFIRTGKFKNYPLKNIIDETNREVSDIFNVTKSNMQLNKKNNEFGDDAFLTNVNVKWKQAKRQKNLSLTYNEEQIADITCAQDRNIELLKIKVQYMAKRQKNLSKTLAKSIIQQSNVFHKKFETAQKIDELLRKTENSNNKTYLSFPRLVEQMRTKQQRRNKTKSVSRGLEQQ